jgi:oligogalacturonide lyase
MRISARFLSLLAAALPATILSAAPPTIFIAGDSAAHSFSARDGGEPIAYFFDPAKVKIVNRARAGSSGRTFFAQGFWQSLVDEMKPGDFVLLQFGQDDSGPLGTGGSLPGIGEETREVVAPDGKRETVYTYGWYMRRFIADSRSKDATPIVVSANEWAAEIARTEKAPFADVARTNPEDAETNATAVVAGLKALPGNPFGGYLAAKGAAVEPSRRAGVVLIGDSTVRNGRGDGRNGQWGWGEPLTAMMAPIPVIDGAMGGRSSRTFLTGGNWDATLAILKAGDVLLIQFGHNDDGPLDDKARARGTLPGVGAETREIDNPITGVHETVHTYGYYLRRYIQEAKARGVKPAICSPIPRDIWQDGKVERRPWAQWAAQVARSQDVPFLDLESLIAARYEALGPEKAGALFLGDHTHTGRAGAEMNARIVAQWLPEHFAFADPPSTWIDPDTGHRVVRLTNEPNSASVYFNQNGYTASRKRLVYTTPDGISALDLESKQARQVVSGRVRLIEAGRKNERVYYVREGAAWWTDVDSGQSHRIGALPPRGSLSTVNADESLLAGVYIEGTQGQDYGGGRSRPEGQVHALDQPPNKAQMMEERWAARLPVAMFTLRIDTGEVKVIHRSNDWLGHLLFSPADPGLLMFCHEGPWHKVERIWTIRSDGTNLTKIHTRTMAMEIFGHEFWGADGRTIWYDLQTPRGEDFWVAGYNVATGARTWYRLERNEWSIHFNVSRDGGLFCGDGGDPGQVAHAPDGEWIYLFRPRRIENAGIAGQDLIQPGVFRAEKLVNMAKHRYRLEPNVGFTPDSKWVVFRSNMFGPTYVFAVEVERSTK